MTKQDTQKPPFVEAGDANEISVCRVGFVARLEDPNVSGRQIANFLFEFLFVRQLVLRAAACQLVRFGRTDSPAGLQGDVWECLAHDLDRVSYDHIDDDHFVGWLWRVVSRAAGRVLKQETDPRTLVASQIEFDFSKVADGTISAVEEEVKRNDFERVLRRIIVRKFRGRLRRVLLVQLATQEIQETAKECALSGESVKRYLRAAWRRIEPLLADWEIDT